MDDKDKVAMYLEVYKLELERFYKSRDIEWKVNFSFWTLIIASGVFLIEHKIKMNLLSYCVACVPLLILHFLWLKKIQQSQESIQQNLKNYESKAEKILSGEKKGTVKKQAFLGLNEELVWEELIKKGYIDSNGTILDKFYKIKKFTDDVFSGIPDIQKKQIYDILAYKKFSPARTGLEWVWCAVGFSIILMLIIMIIINNFPQDCDGWF